VKSDAGLSTSWELAQALGLTDLGANLVTDCRTAKKAQHAPVALMWQSIVGGLPDYRDTKEVERLSVDPAMRHVAGLRATERRATSPTQMWCFERCGVESGLANPETGSKNIKKARARFGQSTKWTM